MRNLEEPDAPRGRGLWILLVLAMAAAVVAWYALDGPVEPPAETVGSTTGTATGPHTSGNERPAPTERNAPGKTAPTTDGGKAARPVDRAPKAAPPTPAPTAARQFRVTTDVPGAYVFLDRKYLGTTPLSSDDVAAGSYQLNVQVEGRPPVVQTVDVAPDGLTEVAVTLPPAAASPAAAATIDADVAVVHQHAVGSCEGTLRASGTGFRYETSHKDAFTLPYAAVETFTVDYTAKRLRLKQRGGRTWNFTTTATNADPLFVFHRDVDAARPR